MKVKKLLQDVNVLFDKHMNAYNKQLIEIKRTWDSF